MNLFDILNKETRSFAATTNTKGIKSLFEDFGYDIWNLKCVILDQAVQACKSFDWNDVFSNLKVDEDKEFWNLLSLDYICEQDGLIYLFYTDHANKYLYNKNTGIQISIKKVKNGFQLHGIALKK